jgi:hypothetical protein
LATTAVELPIHDRPTPIEAPVDPIARAIEACGGNFAPGGRSTVRGAIETLVRAITAPVQTPLDSVTALVEPMLDPVAAPIRTLGGVGPNLRGAHE